MYLVFRYANTGLSQNKGSPNIPKLKRFGCMYVSIYLSIYVSIYLSTYLCKYVSMYMFFISIHVYWRDVRELHLKISWYIWCPPSNYILQTARLPALQGAAPKASDPQEHSPCEEVPWFSRTEKSCRELGALTFSVEDKMHEYLDTTKFVYPSPIVCSDMDPQAGAKDLTASQVYPWQFSMEAQCI